MLEFITAVALLVGGYFFVNGAGYWIHKALHQTWLGAPYQAHQEHHELMYPPNDYLSDDKYRFVSTESSPIWYYTPPAIIAVAVACFLFPWYLSVLFVVELALVSWLNDWIHMCIHIRGHWLERFDWFWQLRDLHWHHHVDDQENLGIISMTMDKVVGTFKVRPTAPPYRRGVSTLAKKLPAPQKLPQVVVTVVAELEGPPATAEEYETANP